MGLPERIKIIRESMGLSQKDMAKTLGSSLPSIQNYEAGNSVPGGNIFEALVKLGFNANWLLTGEGDMGQGGTMLQAQTIVQEGRQEAQEYKRNSVPYADRAWLHDWIEEELQGKTISEVMAVAVKIKSVLDENKGK